MNHVLEDELARTLRARAETVTDVPPGLWDTIERTARRRRRHRRTVLCAGLVVVLLAVAAGGWRLAMPAPTRVGQLYPATAVSPTPAPDRIDRVVAPPSSPGTIRSVDQVWPEAVTRMPATTSGGASVAPVAPVDATHVLVSVSPSFEKQTRLLLYDRRTGHFSSVADLRSPGHLTEYFPQVFATDDRTVAWYADGRDAKGRPRVEFVAADLAGGHERLLATVPGDMAMTELELVDHRWLVYSGAGGVYRIPLSGKGKPALVPGGAGLHLAVWPWAGNVTGEEGGTPRTARMTNLVTGATRTVAAPEADRFEDCVADWCVGSTRPTATGPSTVVAGPRPDRSTVAPSYVSMGGRFGLGRFVDAAYDDHATRGGHALPNLVWDIKTGTVATYHNGPLTINHRTCMLAWKDPAHPGTLLVFDGAAVP